MAWMTCVIFVSKLDYSGLFDHMSNWTLSQVGQKNDHLGQNETSSQIEQNKMTSFVKINNGVLIKWNILCYLIGQDSY
jgi:hypothetical protein